MDPDPSSEYGSNLDSDSQHWLHFSDSAQQDGKDPEVIAAEHRSNVIPTDRFLSPLRIPPGCHPISNFFRTTYC